jgi:hypothetical protein
LNEESIHQVVVDLNDNLALGKVTTISFMENHDLMMNDGGYMISNQHSITTMGESSPEILNPLDPEWEQSSVSPLENHEYTLVCNKSLIEEIHHFQNLKISFSLYKSV